jgi:hypothetical protein
VPGLEAINNSDSNRENQGLISSDSDFEEAIRDLGM